MTEHLDYDAIRANTVRQVAKLMAAAAITAPKSGGQVFIAGKHNFVETVIVDDVDAKHDSSPQTCDGAGFSRSADRVWSGDRRYRRRLVALGVGYAGLRGVVGNVEWMGWK